MNPGELKDKIVFQKLVPTQDNFGQPIDTWPDFLSTRANVQPIVGKEYYAAETIKSEVTHKIKMRYKPNIKPDMRIKFEERYFSIISVINYKERNVELQIMCRELI